MLVSQTKLLFSFTLDRPNIKENNGQTWNHGQIICSYVYCVYILYVASYICCILYSYSCCVCVMLYVASYVYCMFFVLCSYMVCTYVCIPVRKNSSSRVLHVIINQIKSIAKRELWQFFSFIPNSIRKKALPD